MLKLSLGNSGSPLRILCLGAHSDDIEIGCGGTLLRLLGERPGCHVDWIVFSATPVRRKEAMNSARMFLKAAGSKNVVVRGYPDGFFPYQGARIKKEFEQFKKAPAPDLIFTHYRHDLHQDHRLINQLTWNTFRNHVVLEYEIPKFDGDLGSPNFFVDLDEELCRRKVSHLLEAFATQRGKQWFTESTFYALPRLRGIEANSSSQFAEAFYSRKLVV